MGLSMAAACEAVQTRLQPRVCCQPASLNHFTTSLITRHYLRSKGTQCVVFRVSAPAPRHGPMAAPSAQARLTLQDAFERFASTVTPDDQRLFHNTQLKDVRDEAMHIERQLRARRMQKNMARLDPFLRGMEHYSKVVEVLCNGTPYLPWIWAPVKLMLMVSQIPSHIVFYSL
jgi:hypothetical protein